MRLALFDLDRTLLDGDSDLEWSELLAQHGAMDVERVRAFHADYDAGELDIDAFLAFQLTPLAREPLTRLLAWREEWLRERIRPRIAAGARALIASHAARGHECVLVTATNAFLTAPVAEELSIAHLVATEPERRAGRFTGRVAGVPCFRTGKITRIGEWLGARGLGWDDVVESWFYSDSHNDLPLLSAVTHAVAVDPDERLAAECARRGWSRMSLRANSNRLAAS